jgi:pyruvate dehydrogenase (quinone)
MMADCDTLLMIGTNFLFADWLPDEGQARAIQIDLDGRRIGLRHPIEVPLVGDARDTLSLERCCPRSTARMTARGASGSSTRSSGGGGCSRSERSYRASP